MTKILLVEDDKSLREIYGVRLSAEGYEIVSAGDGEEALAMAIKERPNLIISDVMMPKISGFDMLDILRSTTETKDAKVIMMTALSSDDQRARGEALGADRYLVKSQVGIEDVVRTVHDVLEDGVSTPPTSTPQAFGVPIAPASSTDSVAPAVPTTPSVALPEPATPAVAPDPTPTPAPASPAPAAAPSTPAPISIKVQSAPSTVPPMVNTPPQVPAASPFQSEPNVLPQPTAPFSSNRPGSLGDRVISPLDDEPVGPPPDMASLMSQELNGATPATPPVPPAPQA